MQTFMKDTQSVLAIFLVFMMTKIMPTVVVRIFIVEFISVWGEC